MQTAFTLARRHGSQKWEVALGPDTAMRDHRDFLRKRRRSGDDPDYAEVAIVQVQRVVRMAQRDKPAPKPEAKPPAQEAKPPAKKPAARPSTMFGSRVAAAKKQA